MSAHPRRARARVLSALIIASLVGSVTPAPALADPVFPPPGQQVTVPPAANTTLGEFHPLTAKRVFDTRSGLGTTAKKIGSGKARTVDVSGTGGVPSSGAAAVVINVTVSRPTRSGAVTIYPAGASRPASPNVHFSAGETTSNLVIVKVGSNGNLTVYNSAGTTDVAVAVQGWYGGLLPAGVVPLGSTFLHPLGATRIFDTRTGLGTSHSKIGSGNARAADVTGVGGVPSSGVAAVVLNITVSRPTRSGFVTLYPSGASRPNASNIQFASGKKVSNLVVVKVGSGGSIKVYNSAGSTDVAIAVQGWYGGDDSASGGQASPLAATQVFNTTTGLNTGASKIGAGKTRIADVTGIGGVPAAGVAAVVLNVTVSGPTQAGFVTVYASGAARPAPTMNFAAGEKTSNLVVVEPGSNGNVTVYNSAGSTNVTLTVQGWYTKPGTEPDTASAPSRDTLTGSPAGGFIVDAAAVTAGGVAPEPGATQDPWAERTLKAPVKRLFSGVVDSDVDYMVQAHAGGVSLNPDRAGYEQSISPAVGRIYMTDLADNILGTCSGTVVARNLVLTAGHCIYNPVTGTYYPRWVFRPGFFGSSMPYGQWETTQYVVLNLWTQSALFSHDYGFLQINLPDPQGKYVGDHTGWFNILANSQGGSKYAIGYPSEGWFGANGNCTLESCYPYHCEARITDPSTQYELVFEDPQASYGGWFEVGFGCWMTGGASGGPVFELWNNAWYVNGVNSHLELTGAPTYTADCTRPSGICFQWARGSWSPYFNQTALDVRDQYAIP